MWKEKGASKDFTYQGLTTCKEVDRSTKLSTNKQHTLSLNGNDQRIQPIRKKRVENTRGIGILIRDVVEHQELCRRKDWAVWSQARSEVLRTWATPSSVKQLNKARRGKESLKSEVSDTRNTK